MAMRHTRLYRVFAALHEDTDKGWVWVRLKQMEGFRSRSTIKISKGRYSVYCEHRNFDENVVRKYDSSSDTSCIYFGTDQATFADKKHTAKEAVEHRAPVDLSKVQDVIIISGWYRMGLGGINTTEVHELTITRPRFGQWADIRAGCHHPEPAVRIATRLAILGTWLGVAAFLPALAEVEPLKAWLEPSIHYPALGALILAGLFGIVCLFAARGIRR
ncbi:MAG TPA: hypothetical protein VLI55_19070 [Bryobacteraceae bacterium]|nr:hypothetical protein [Bryobacteraceae bacterium]